MSEIWIEPGKMIEVGFGGGNVADLVCDFSEEVVGIADLTRIGGKFQTRLAVMTGPLEILQAKVPEAEIDERLGLVVWSGDECDRFLEQGHAFFELVVQHF